MVSFQSLESVKKVLATKPAFHKKEVVEVRMCNLAEKRDGEFADDDPRIRRMFARQRTAVVARGSK